MNNVTDKEILGTVPCMGKQRLRRHDLLDAMDVGVGYRPSYFIKFVDGINKVSEVRKYMKQLIDEGLVYQKIRAGLIKWYRK